MKTTAAVLKELQDYYDSLDPKPGLKEISSKADIPVATVGRHLNGTTKQGIPSRVRALAIALGRNDLADEVILETPTQNSDAWWIMEIQREARESNIEELERERQLRKEAEERFEKMLASKDDHISHLNDQIQGLKEDKGSLSAQCNNLDRKRSKYERIAMALLLFFGVYFIIFDLPHTDYGITEVILGILNKLK